MDPSTRVDRCLSWLITLAVAGGLAACGGGLYIAVGDDGYDGPPQVGLVASSSSASPGQGLRLAAGASDDFGVRRVEFFRIEGDGTATVLGSDGVAPYEWDTTLPATTANEVRYFARAFDDAGQSTDSTPITVAVQR